MPTTAAVSQAVIVRVLTTDLGLSGGLARNAGTPR